MNLLEQGIGLEEALDAFGFGGQPVGALRYGMGHINDSFVVHTEQPNFKCRRFMLQRINTHVFTRPDQLMQNIIGVTNYLRESIIRENGDPNRETLTVIPDKKGNPYYMASDGRAWRVYLFIEDAITYQSATPELFAASARAYGKFSQMLRDYPAETLHETINRFHDTPNRYKNFIDAVAADKAGRVNEVRKEIEFVMQREQDCHVLMNLLEQGQLPLRVTHNDTKLNNVMIDPSTMQGVCVIDLDTVMPGLMGNDYGDSIRFGATTAAEDETDLSLVNFSLPLYRVYTQNYLETAGSAMTPLEKEMLPWGARLMTLECGIRFFTDYLEGDTYFKIHRPAQNLDRSRTQFKLVQDMEDNWEEINLLLQQMIEKQNRG